MTVLFVNAESHDGDHDIPHHYTTFLTPEGSLLADSPLPPAPAAAPNRPGYDGWNLSGYELRFVPHGQEAQPVNFDATPPLPPNKPNEEFNWESLETMPSLTKLAPGAAFDATMLAYGERANTVLAARVVLSDGSLAGGGVPPCPFDKTLWSIGAVTGPLAGGVAYTVQAARELRLEAVNLADGTVAGIFVIDTGRLGSMPLCINCIPAVEDQVIEGLELTHFHPLYAVLNPNHGPLPRYSGYLHNGSAVDMPADIWLMWAQKSIEAVKCGRRPCEKLIDTTSESPSCANVQISVSFR
jgi:hypothetical protein